MNNEIIKLLKLDNMNIDESLSSITRYNNKLIYHIYVKKEDNITCPVCSSCNCVIHDYRISTIKHSVLNTAACEIKYHRRRYKCKVCNKIFYEKNNFCQKKHSTSYVTIISVLDDLRSHTATFTSVAKKHFLSVQNVINIFETHVECRRKKLPEALCIDEIYTRRLTKCHPYSCVMMDFKEKQLIDIVSSRRKEHLETYFNAISDSERKNVKYIVIDMYEPYKQLAGIYFKDAKIAIDSFHVMKNLNDAMNKIRIRITNKYKDKHLRLEDANPSYYMLKKFSYYFTTNFDNIRSNRVYIKKFRTRWDKCAIRAYLLDIDEELKFAYILWDRYFSFNFCANLATADEEMEDLMDSFLNSKSPEFRSFGKLLRHWKKEIKNSFITVDDRRLSNGCMEGANARLKCLIKSANGFRDFEHFRNRALFAVNKNMPIKL